MTGTIGGTMTEKLFNTCVDGYSRYKDNTPADRGFAACILGGFVNNSMCGHKNLTPYEQMLVKDSIGLTSDNKYKLDMCVGIYDAWRGSLSKNIKYRSSIDQFPDAAAIHEWIDENADMVSTVIGNFDGNHASAVAVAERYFLAAYNLGMFSGVDADGNFNPYGAFTRAQLCQALYSVGWTYKGVTYRYIR